MNVIEHLEHVIGLIGKAPNSEIKSKLIGIREEVAENAASAAKYSELAEKYAALQKAQANESQGHPKPALGDLVESMGVLWKRTATGFEPHPYCKECVSHPVMTPMQYPGIWVCGTGDHHAPLSVRPPTT